MVFITVVVGSIACIILYLPEEHTSSLYCLFWLTICLLLYHYVMGENCIIQGNNRKRSNSPYLYHL
ncbi:hypothetical protein F5Y12DRAFT_473460 [Xylaria sp. FL1777]|nr:hypothetical protein F5Y12DRAFT_473460 [Xylaria sp. FL1777]